MAFDDFFEGRRGRAIGGTSFALFTWTIFNALQQADLLHIDYPSSLWRWRAYLMLLSFLAGLSLNPIRAFSSIMGAAIFAATASFGLGLLYAGGYWANTGEIEFHDETLSLLIGVTLPIFLPFSLWIVYHEAPPDRSSVIRVSANHPAMTLIGVVITVAASLIIAKVKLVLTWAQFLEYALN